MPDVSVYSISDISKTKHSKMMRDLKNLVKSEQAKFIGRGVSKENGQVYQIYQLQDKQLLIEDRAAGEILMSLLNSDGMLREITIK